VTDLSLYLAALMMPSQVTGEAVPDDAPGQAVAVVEGHLVVDGRRVTTAGGWDVMSPAVSPEGDRAVLARTEHGSSGQLPLVDWLAVPVAVDWVPSVAVGEPTATTTISLVDLASGAETPVTLDDSALQVWQVVAWVDGDPLLLAMSADTRHLQLVVVAADGTTRTVVEERSTTFLNGIRVQDTLRTATWLPEQAQVVWLSERTGWRHAYLYDLDGTPRGALTSGDLEVSEVVGADSPTSIVVLASSDPGRPYDVHVCRVGLDGTGFTQLSTDPGLHTARLGADGVLDTHSSINRPPRTDLIPYDGSSATTLATATVPDGPLPQCVEIQVPAPDGTPLHGVMWLPHDFDATRRYPLVEFLYAGPQNVMHPRDFRQGGATMGYALAALGFVSVVVDGHGTPCRGKAFQDAVFGRFGTFEVAEHAHVLEHLLAEHPFLDRDRVGVIGSSWGGYFAVRAMLQRPDLFAAGVAIYPVPDLVHQPAGAIEPYLPPYGDDPETYERGSNLPFVDALRGRLLLVAGTHDRSATFPGVMRLVDAFLRADKDVDLVVAPGLDHDSTGAFGPYVVMRAARYLVEHLRPGGEEHG